MPTSPEVREIVRALDKLTDAVKDVAKQLADARREASLRR
jgi:uncharacterized protein YukE